ncbi:MAG TPA: universal stress protein, partial [Isosphaeraceae bacterium]|nr:universal stress protein [Isosphaeraceae bacterium]
MSESKSVFEIKRILAPTDFSGHSAAAVRFACQIAERLGSELHLLHVLSEILPTGPDPLLMPVLPPEFYKDNEDRAKQTLDGLLQADWGKPLKVVRVVRWGSPVESIVSHALDEVIDMIVIA